MDGEARRVLAQRREEQESRVPHTCGSRTPRSNAFPRFSQKFTRSALKTFAVVLFPMHSPNASKIRQSSSNHSTLFLPLHRTVFYRKVWTDWRTKKGRKIIVVQTTDWRLDLSPRFLVWQRTLHKTSQTKKKNPAGEVRAVYRTNKAFNRPKDRIPTQSQSNLIYQFECRRCGSRYVGKTAQRFLDRISQHVPKHVLDAVLDLCSGNGPEDRRRSEKILQKGTNRRWRVTLQRTPIAAGLTVTLTLLSCLVVGQNNIVMSLKLCTIVTFVVLNQCYVGRNHLLYVV